MWFPFGFPFGFRLSLLIVAMVSLWFPFGLLLDLHVVPFFLGSKCCDDCSGQRKVDNDSVACLAEPVMLV